jgi:Ca2+-binding RTX toxin-like protein
LFLQAELADSRFNTTPIPYQNASFDGYTTTVIYNDVNASGAELPYVTGDTPEQIKWNINAMLQDAIQGVPSLANSAAQLDNLSQWHFDSTYVGLEMGGINAPKIAGTATLDMQVSNLNLQYDPSTTYKASTAPNGGNALISASYGDAPRIQFTDHTSGLSGTTFGAAYTGPVAGIKSEYLYEGTDSMSFIAPESTYIVGGHGDDNITATSGNNILDGGAGSNVLTGGSGKDTFYLSGLSGLFTSDTINNFHSGDMATIWGALSNVKWIDTHAVSGNPELTLLATGSKGQSLSMNFTGLSTSDLSHLSIQYGNVGGTPDMFIYNF